MADFEDHTILWCIYKNTTVLSTTLCAGKLLVPNSERYTCCTFSGRLHYPQKDERLLSKETVVVHW